MGRRKNNLKKKRKALKIKRMEACLEYYWNKEMDKSIHHFICVLMRELEIEQSYRWN